MNIIPIVFAFNHRVLMPAGVCFTSLLKSAKEDTFYDMFILHGPGELNDDHQAQLTSVQKDFKNCKISFINIGDAFDNVYLARGVPKLTYYRILIPELILQYDKVIFSDVDIIFKNDLANVFHETDLTGNYLAGVRNYLIKEKYIRDIGCDPANYINGGFQIYNLKAIREDDMTPKLKALCGGKYFYLDQDISNIVYKDRITFLSPRYNSTQTFYKLAHQPSKKFLELFTATEIEEGLDPYIIHYTGVNPWQSLCARHDIWWQYYRDSAFYNEAFYFAHYEKILNPKPKALFKQLSNDVVMKPLKKIYRKIIPR